MSVQPGESFPEFTALDHEGNTVNLSDYRSDKKLVVFFYPKATTRGCVRETTEFSVRREEFDALDTRIVGISIDDVGLQKEHAIQCAANFPLLSDLDKHLTSELGIENENGRSKRTTYLIDRGGKVAQIYAGVTVDGHVDQVLDGVKHLSS
jgi:peroxiredoxin Q/BCP